MKVRVRAKGPAVTTLTASFCLYWSSLTLWVFNDTAGRIRRLHRVVAEIRSDARVHRRMPCADAVLVALIECWSHLIPESLDLYIV